MNPSQPRPQARHTHPLAWWLAALIVALVGAGYTIASPAQPASLPAMGDATGDCPCNLQQRDGPGPCVDLRPQ